jgi:hypothetical protein
MAKHIIFVHGRSYKPEATYLKRNWTEALGHGLERDHGKRVRTSYNGVKKTMAYYGDLSNDFLSKNSGTRWTEKKNDADKLDRRETLRALKTYQKNEFTKSNYRNVKDYRAIFDNVADIISGPLSILGIGDALIETFAPDMAHYWDNDKQWGSDVRWRVTVPLERALKAGDDVLLISHSLGTIASYDVLWKFSHYGEYQHIRDRKVSLLITMGSPLGDNNVNKQLKGADLDSDRRFPGNIERWINVAARDDYIAHDDTLDNDFKKMLKRGLVKSITDKDVYNLAVRHGKSNPHHSTGYLITPTISKIVKNWLD